MKDIRTRVWNTFASFKEGYYFPEEQRRAIENYISKKVLGKNLDLGGGWYSYRTDSFVLDISEVSLRRNPAPEEKKFLFDLDDIREKGLPFPENFFDSATIISVWRFLRYPFKVLEETQRIVKPSGKIYVICNNYGVRNNRLVVDRSDVNEIFEQIRTENYEVKKENIFQTPQIESFVVSAN